MVKALLNVKTFASVTNKASKIATKISTSSSKWAVKFYNTVDDVYDKKLTLKILTIGATRWNSAQAMFASQLRVKTACRVFHTLHNDEDDFPAEFEEWHSDSFWHDMEEAELLIRPFCEASFILQCDGRTMADVFLILLNLYSHLSVYAAGTLYAGKIKKVIECRWLDEDQHLYILAFALHPRYRKFMVKLLKRSELDFGLWSATKNVFSVARITMAAKFYFTKHRVWMLLLGDDEQRQRARTDANYRKEEVTRQCRMLGIDVKKWLMGSTFDDGLSEDDYMGGHPVEFWQQQRREHSHIARFSQWLFSAGVQSASCERLFKDYLQFHTKKRNKLGHGRVHQQALVRRHIRRNRKTQYRGEENKATSTNRFVNPKERPKKKVGAEQDTQITQDPGVAIATEPMEESESDSEDDSDVDENEVSSEWMKALLAAAPADAFDEELMDLQDDPIGGPVPQTEDDVDYFEDHRPPEFCCEEVWEDPAPLPDINYATYPQENQAYFMLKKEVNYVRKDKVSLEKIVNKICAALGEDAIPGMRSVYQDRVFVERDGW